MVKIAHHFSLLFVPQAIAAEWRLKWKIPESKILVNGGGSPIRSHMLENTNRMKIEVEKIWLNLS
jgi:hypothetical protein